jgi:hypothetical protein
MLSRGAEGYACLRQENRCIRYFLLSTTANDPVVSLVASLSCRSSATQVRIAHSWLITMSLEVQLSHNFARQFLHYHRAGHGAIASPQTQRGYTVFVHTRTSRVIATSSIHVRTTGFENEEMKVAYPTMLFDRTTMDKRATRLSTKWRRQAA